MKTDVLDHGYVRLVETWGVGDARLAEAGIIEAARQSTQGAFRGWETDEKLLATLYSNDHDTPFEFAGMVIEVQAPIFVFREWHRHRTQSYNEMSARYAPLPDVNYTPSVERCCVAPGRNTQANPVKGAKQCTPDLAQLWLENLEDAYAHVQRVYEQGLAFGIPKEVARCPVSVGRYSRMRAATSVRCWLMFLTLRMAPYAQWEIRQYANAVGEIIAKEFPRTWALYHKGGDDLKLR